MLIVLGVIAALALGGIIYLFFSGKSSKIQKMAALGALVLSGLTLGVCGVILIFGGSGQKEDPYALNLPAEHVEPAAKNGMVQLVIYLVILLAAFGIVIFLGIRDRKSHDAGKPAVKNKKKGFSIDEF